MKANPAWAFALVGTIAVMITKRDIARPSARERDRLFIEGLLSSLVLNVLQNLTI